MLEDMIQRRDSPDSETWLVLLNAVTTAEALDKAVALIERSRVEGRGSEVSWGVMFPLKSNDMRACGVV